MSRRQAVPCRRADGPGQTAKEKGNHRERKVLESGLCRSCELQDRREKARKGRADRVQRTYALGPLQHEFLFAQQGGRCPHGRKITLRSPVDHNHNSGAVRGLLCDPCNRFLGYIGDSPEALLNLWAYLLRPPAQVDPVTDHEFYTWPGLVQCIRRDPQGGGMTCGRLKMEHRPGRAVPLEHELTAAGELDILTSALKKAHAEGTAWTPAMTRARESLWQKVSLYGVEPSDPQWRTY